MKVFLCTSLILVVIFCANAALAQETTVQQEITTTSTVLSAVNTTKTPVSDGGKIVGGIEVKIGDYPYQLSLRDTGRHYCGASIIHAFWALTAAHCVQIPILRMTLRAGTSDRTTGGTIHLILLKIPHASYNPTTHNYDIALLKVVNPFVYSSNIRNIALPIWNTAIPAGLNSTVSGWGTMNPGATTLPTILRAVSIPIVSQASCRSSYGTTQITNQMVCAGAPTGGKDSCQGDSGGPLVGLLSGVKQLIGVVSWGRSCALAGYPGVYTNVPVLRAWIKTNTLNVV